MYSLRLKSLNLKYQRFTTSGCKFKLGFENLSLYKQISNLQGYKGICFKSLFIDSPREV